MTLDTYMLHQIYNFFILCIYNMPDMSKNLKENIKNRSLLSNDL